MASIYACGSLGQTKHAASEAAMTGMIRSPAQESARNEITQNALTSGYIDIEMLRAVSDRFSAAVPMRHLVATGERTNVIAFWQAMYQA